MKKDIIKIGTRGSKLAIFQAEQVKKSIEKLFLDFDVELKIIKTKGDKILDVSLDKIGDKGLFTKELETALLKNEIDIAVHSLKDLPTALPDGLVLGGVMKRDEVRDVLISKNGKKLNELSGNDIIATSSLRRKAQLLNYNHNFKITDIRGNVDTRLKKMEEGYCTALVIAGAGVIRLGLENKITEFIRPDIMLPAVSQGIIAIECREDDGFIMETLKKISHKETMIVAKAERSFLKTLEGGCQIPVACYTSVVRDVFKITGYISDLKGETVLKKGLAGSFSEAETIAVRLANIMLNYGGRNILEEMRN